MSAPLPVSTAEWIASERSEALPENAAAMPLDTAISRLPAIAERTAVRVSDMPVHVQKTVPGLLVGLDACVLHDFRPKLLLGLEQLAELGWRASHRLGALLHQAVMHGGRS